MPELIVKLRSGVQESVVAEIGKSVMENIRDAGVDELLATCGGCCSCATCHVYIEETAKLPPISDAESGLLEGSDHRTKFSRLSCQILFTEELAGLVVQIAPED